MTKDMKFAVKARVLKGDGAGDKDTLYLDHMFKPDDDFNGKHASGVCRCHYAEHFWLTTCPKYYPDKKEAERAVCLFVDAAGIPIAEFEIIGEPG